MHRGSLDIFLPGGRGMRRRILSTTAAAGPRPPRRWVSHLDGPQNRKACDADTTFTPGLAGTFGAPYGQQPLSFPQGRLPSGEQSSADSASSKLAATDSSDEAFSMGSMAGTLPGVRQPLPGMMSPHSTHRTPHGAPSQFQHLPQPAFQFASQSGHHHAPPHSAFTQYAPSHSPGPQGSMNSPYLFQPPGSMQRAGLGGLAQQGYPGAAIFQNQQSPSNPLMLYQSGFGPANTMQHGLQGIHQRSRACSLS